MANMKTTTNRFKEILETHRNYLKPVDYTIRMVGIVLCLLVLLEVLSFVSVTLYTSVDTNKAHKVIDIDAYEDKEWAADYFDEFIESSQTEYYPYLGYRRLPHYKGSYVNLDNNSVRTTLNPCSLSSLETIKIFMLGGSTVWGTGAREEGTIPSQLSRELCEDGYGVEVFNFGESGYTSFHTLIRLQLELRKGNIPDIVVCYDGINDVFSSDQNGVAGLPQNVINRQNDYNARDRMNIRAVFPHFFRITDRIIGARSEKSLTITANETLNVETARVYLNTVKLIKVLEDGFGFKSFFYWQPSFYTKAILSNHETTKIKYEEAMDRDYNKVASLVNVPPIISLTGVFDHNTETIFIDWIHISEEGNSIIAREMSKDIVKYEEEVRSAAGRTGS